MQEAIAKKSSYEDHSKFLLRFTIGFLMLFHGVAKIGNTGFIESGFEAMGIPTFLAYGVYLGEIVAPIMLILGIKVRLAAVLIIGTMLTAIFMAHSGDIFSINKYGAWAIELPMFYILASISVLLSGTDRFCIYKK